MCVGGDWIISLLGTETFPKKSGSGHWNPRGFG